MNIDKRQLLHSLKERSSILQNRDKVEELELLIRFIEEGLFDIKVWTE